MNLRFGCTLVVPKEEQSGTFNQDKTNVSNYLLVVVRRNGMKSTLLGIWVVLGCMGN